MVSDDLIGICGECTTYRDDFRAFEAKKMRKKQFRDRKKSKSKIIEIPVFAESHDTFQKLDYRSRIPFDALWRPKEIVGTDPRSSVQMKHQPDVNDDLNISRTKLAETVSPAVNVDDLKDLETRELIAKYIYKSTVARSTEEVWPNFGKNDTKCNNIISSNPEEPVKTKNQLIPAKFLNVARKWDSLQSRRLIDRKNLTSVQSCHSYSAETNDCDHRRAISELLKDGKKLRLPYEKLPLSYGGHRTPVALGVPLEKKKVSPYHPDLTVYQALTSCHD